jgi:outer membrane receptor protein involved in Fe transport
MNATPLTTTTRLAAALVLLLASLGPGRSGAGEDQARDAPTPRDEQDLRELLSAPVEAASKIPQSVLEAPSVVSAVSRRTVESYGWTNYQFGAASLAATVLYQGSVARRPSDLLTPENRLLRPDTIPPWTSVDLNASWQARRWLRLAIRVTNALDAGGRIITTGDYPFDGHIEGRRIVGSLVLQP